MMIRKMCTLYIHRKQRDTLIFTNVYLYHTLILTYPPPKSSHPKLDIKINLRSQCSLLYVADRSYKFTILQISCFSYSFCLFVLSEIIAN